MDTFQVYVIHSSKPVSQLKEILDCCGGHNYAGIIYKSTKGRKAFEGKGEGRSGNGKEETKKTIVFCPEHTIIQLEKAFPDFAGKIANYNWDSFPLPDESLGETWNLHISGVPNDYTDVEAQEFIKASLSVILPFEEDGRVNYKVEFPSRLRETGEISGYGKVIFEEHVDHEIIKHCKIILNNTPRAFKNNPKERRMISCTWHRNQKMVSRVDSFASAEGSEESGVKYVVKPRAGAKIVRKARPAVIHVLEADEDPQVDMSKVDVSSKEMAKSSGMVMKK